MAELGLLHLSILPSTSGSAVELESVGKSHSLLSVSPFSLGQDTPKLLKYLLHFLRIRLGIGSTLLLA
ncbi:hypothetical protein Ancab_037958 [Ancistrocladus abbreviatus]